MSIITTKVIISQNWVIQVGSEAVHWQGQARQCIQSHSVTHHWSADASASRPSPLAGSPSTTYINSEGCHRSLYH
jgi:hypothetical protein